MMSDLQTLFKEVDDLSPDEIKQLLEHIAKRHGDLADAKSQDESLKPRVLGLHAHLGEAWMSDDFDDELPDSFWFGEE